MVQENEQLAAFVREVVKATVQETLLSMGLNVNDPIKTQRFMANLAEVEQSFLDNKFQQDLLHLRKWREAMESASSLSMKAVLTIVVGGLLTALWIGIKTNFRP